MWHGSVKTIWKTISSEFISSNRIANLNNAKAMSVYAPYYIDPIFKKSQLAEILEAGELGKYSGSPVKAPEIDDTCSTYYDETVQKFINHVMIGGQKILARTLIEKTFEKIKRKQIERYHLTSDPEKKKEIELDPRKIFNTALINSRPLLELQPVRRGGVTYQVPVPVVPNRAIFLSIKWMIEAAKDKDKSVHFPERLASELLSAADNQGKVIKRKQDLHKQCESNRAYAHYRWS